MSKQAKIAAASLAALLVMFSGVAAWLLEDLFRKLDHSAWDGTMTASEVLDS